MTAGALYSVWSVAIMQAGPANMVLDCAEPMSVYLSADRFSGSGEHGSQRSAGLAHSSKLRELRVSRVRRGDVSYGRRLSAPV